MKGEFKDCATVSGEAEPGRHLEDYEKMARRRFQNPVPKREGRWWYIRVWQDQVINGVPSRKRQRMKIAPASMNVREVKKIASELLRPQNQGLIAVGAALTFEQYVETTYRPVELPLLANTTQSCYQAHIGKYLMPAFGSRLLRELTPLALQSYFSGLPKKNIKHDTIVKLRDALSSVLNSAVRYEYLVKNPMQGLKLPPDKRGRRKKPIITPEQFAQLIEWIPEPYSTMIYVAVLTGLRISEVCALKWHCVLADSNRISVEERFSRGDWSHPKTQESAATINVIPEVIARLERLKMLTVSVRAGHGVRRHRLVKISGPDDLVFQSVWKGRPMSDGNILRRHIKPAAARLGLQVNWLVLRRSHATWLVQGGADPKSVQAQMRHARSSTTMYMYAQAVGEQQRLAVDKLRVFAQKVIQEPVPLLSQ